MTKLLAKAQAVKLLICDIDGVLTDGRLHITQDGIHYLSFHVHDGLGLKLLMHSGIEVAIITTSPSPIIDCRMQQLGIKHYFKHQYDKLIAYEQLQQSLSLEDKQIAYIGDDLIDLPVLERAGLSIAVANAVSEVQQQVSWVTTKAGGQGAVREVCELIMRAQGTRQDALTTFTNSINKS